MLAYGVSRAVITTTFGKSSFPPFLIDISFPFHRSLPVVSSSPLAVWAGCPSLLRSVRLWIIETNVVDLRFKYR
ncbi:hypothetical protein L2E82_12134 [Cichorium intybus]|uniref:Uncharacterized protein n=1 Tax=Cichorium intybus TaxID=13427 RepID=A0ACB9GGA1_CICIN|nr:hypothetical protein L2E82_12134 [Cichorium intybus]